MGWAHKVWQGRFRGLKKILYLTGWVQVMGTGLRGGFVRKETRLEPELLPFLIWRRKVVMAHGYPWIRCHKTNISHGFEDKEAVVDGHWCHGASLPSGTNEGWWWWLVWVCWVLFIFYFLGNLTTYSGGQQACRSGWLLMTLTISFWWHRKGWCGGRTVMVASGDGFFFFFF